MTTLDQQPQKTEEMQKYHRLKLDPICQSYREKNQSKIWLRMTVGRSEDECVAEWWLALDTLVFGGLAHYIILTPGSLTSRGLSGRRAGILTPTEDAILEKRPATT